MGTQLMSLANLRVLEPYLRKESMENLANLLADGTFNLRYYPIEIGYLSSIKQCFICDGHNRCGVAYMNNRNTVPSIIIPIEGEKYFVDFLNILEEEHILTIADLVLNNRILPELEYRKKLNLE